MTLEAIQEFEQALLSVDRHAAKAVIEGLRDRVTISEVLGRVIVPALERIGVGWDEGTVALSQVYMSGRICEELVDQLLPPKPAQEQKRPTTAIVTLDDYHLLGKRIVYSILRAAGHDLLDYRRLDVETLVDRVQKDNVDLLLVSVLMYPSALRIKELRENLPEDVRIVVGGAPFRFDAQLWEQVGADGVGRNASDALDLVERFSADKAERGPRT